MKLEKNQIKDRITLHLQENEYLIILATLKAATADDSRNGIAYFGFYGADKGEVVALHNAIDEAERRA
jgi:hypothetical protein